MRDLRIPEGVLKYVCEQKGIAAIMKKEETTAEHLRKEFEKLHQLFVPGEGASVLWSGEARDAFQEKEAALFEEAVEIISRMEKER